jgi:hypothetical protein
MDLVLLTRISTPLFSMKNFFIGEKSMTILQTQADEMILMESESSCINLRRGSATPESMRQVLRCGVLLDNPFIHLQAMILISLFSWDKQLTIKGRTLESIIFFLPNSFKEQISDKLSKQF